MKKAFTTVFAVLLSASQLLFIAGCGADGSEQKLDEIATKVNEISQTVNEIKQQLEAVRQAELAAAAAEEEARLLAEEEARLAAEEQARLAAEEQARLAAEEAAIQRIGVERENDQKIRLYNETGMEISSVVVNDLTTGESTGELLGEGEMFPEHERAYLCFPATEGNEYEVALKWPDGSSYTLHSFPVYHVDEAQLIWGDHVAYLEYTDTQDGSAVSTHDAEVANREQVLAEKAAAEEAARQAAAAAWSDSGTGANSGGCLDDALFW